MGGGAGPDPLPCGFAQGAMASLARVRLFGARAAQPVARRMARGKATAVEATAPEAALQPKKTYSAGDKQLMEAEYTEDIGHLFGEKVRRPPPPPPRRPPPRLQRRGRLTTVYVRL